MRESGMERVGRERENECMKRESVNARTNFVNLNFNLEGLKLFLVSSFFCTI